jgi:hypothetical protein
MLKNTQRGWKKEVRKHLGGMLKNAQRVEKRTRKTSQRETYLWVGRSKNILDRIYPPSLLDGRAQNYPLSLSRLVYNRTGYPPIHPS